MFDTQVIHTEHRDVIHDCSYDYYGQVRAPDSRKREIPHLLLFNDPTIQILPENGDVQLRSDH